MPQYQGKYIVSESTHIAVVISRFNETVTQLLLNSCIDGLERHNVCREQIHIYWVPGAFEIPVVAQRLALSQKFSAVICLGAVIRGATPHFDYVAGPVATQIANISLKTDVPVIFGVITTDTMEQALERSGIKGGNKGFEAALCTLEMISLLEQIPSELVKQF